ncbi:DUF2829 domain-containing protein [Pantoea sp. 18069]|uniref:DUF2829 domain-containing protein n=1 Tax=Pantoea sp. 18069 TaxID=2681415 RepID=UPI00190F377D|nr:DUF2829 domain-containing protein [Pantoea sp. 18069]
MTKYRKKPVVIEAVTFDELVAHGLKNCTSAVDGMPWAFDYNGHPITHENDDCYLIPTLEGVMKMGRSDMLLTGVKGEIYPCKRDIFEATYDVLGGSAMTFGQAIEAAKVGQRIARTGWNGKGMFVYLVPAASYPVQTGAAKAHFGEGAMVPYNPYLAIKNVDETVSTWVPSVNDCLAGDWGVVGQAVPGHQQRVLAEKLELDLRISALDPFIDRNPIFATLPVDEQARLKRQLDVMHELSSILGERIAQF